MKHKDIINQLGQSNVARELGITRNAVFQWTTSRVPAERCQALVDYAFLRGMAIRKSDLRPDVFDPQLD